MPDGPAYLLSTPESCRRTPCTRPNPQTVVVSTIAIKGCEVFLPLYRAVHRRQERNTQVALPRLPHFRWQPSLRPDFGD